MSLLLFSVSLLAACHAGAPLSRSALLLLSALVWPWRGSHRRVRLLSSPGCAGLDQQHSALCMLAAADTWQTLQRQPDRPSPAPAGLSRSATPPQPSSPVLSSGMVAAVCALHSMVRVAQCLEARVWRDHRQAASTGLAAARGLGSLSAGGVKLVSKAAPRYAALHKAITLGFVLPLEVLRLTRNGG